MSAKQKPICQSGPAWLKEVAANLWSRIGLKESNKRPLAALTGQDSKAYSTFLHALELWTYCDDEGRMHALMCMHHAVMAMQPQTRWVCRASIPHLLDWGYQQTLWPLIIGEQAAGAKRQNPPLPAEAELPPEFRDGTLQTKRQEKWRAWRTDREDGIEGTGDTEIEAVMALAEQYRQIEKDMGEGASS